MKISYDKYVCNGSRSMLGVMRRDVSISGGMFVHHDYVSKMLLSSIGTVSFNKSVRV